MYEIHTKVEREGLVRECWETKHDWKDLLGQGLCAVAFMGIGFVFLVMLPFLMVWSVWDCWWRGGRYR